MKLFLFIFLLSSCAGPTSPFGSNIFVSNEFVSHDQENQLKNSLEVVSSSAVKLYNSPYDLKIKLKSPTKLGTNFRYDIVYNNDKLKRWWKTEDITFSEDKKEVTIEFKKLSLNAGVENQIYFVFYQDESSKPMIYEIKGPSCELKYNTPFVSQALLSQGDEYIQSLNDMALKYNMNSNFLAALVEEESSFNPKALGRNKEIGLTQLSPKVTKDIGEIKKDWPIQPDLENMNFLKLKYKIESGEINKDNDWRLDGHKNLEGGILALKNIMNFWNNDQNRSILSANRQTIPLTDIVLASYKAGIDNVKESLIQNGDQWLASDSLETTKKYLMNIKSFCFQLTQRGNNGK